MSCLSQEKTIENQLKWTVDQLIYTWDDIRSDDKLNVRVVSIQIQLMDAEEESVLMVDSGRSGAIVVVI